MYICFRSVILDVGDDPDLFTSWNPADNTITNGSVGSISSVRGKTGDAWYTAVLKPNVSSQANNIYSMSLRLDAKTGETVPSDFEIDNISYVYRNKNIK